jgi:hypothetical protein
MPRSRYATHIFRAGFARSGIAIACDRSFRANPFACWKRWDGRRAEQREPCRTRRRCLERRRRAVRPARGLAMVQRHLLPARWLGRCGSGRP